MFNHNKFEKTDNSKQGCLVEQQHYSDVYAEMEHEMIDVTLVIDTLPDTPLLSTSSLAIPLMLLLPHAQTSTRQMIHDSEGSCYNNYVLFLRSVPNFAFFCSLFEHMDSLLIARGPRGFNNSKALYMYSADIRFES
jgi:hypothetical protein